MIVARRLVLVGILLTSLSSIGPAPAGESAEQAHSVPPGFLGSWTGTGTLFGTEASFRMVWEEVLGGRFVRLVFSNSMTQGEDSRGLDAEAFYWPDGDRLRGSWYDSRGLVLPLEAVATDDRLTTTWGSPETERGQTVYRLSESGITVEDSVWRDGELQVFARASYRRIAEPAGVSDDREP